MSNALRTPAAETAFHIDRPGWIPSHIISNWDKDPYAYQTEEELMPAGTLHGKILAYIISTLEHFLKEQNLMLLVDVFVLYRDRHGIKQRFSPDLLLTPFRSDELKSYDLDQEPIPKVLIEVTSAKSHKKDLKDNVTFYSNLGVSTYLVIDAVTPQDESRKQFGLHLWQFKRGKFQRGLPDNKGFFLLPEMQIRVKAQGQHLIFKDALTDKIIENIDQLRIGKEKERDEKEQYKLLAEKEKLKAEKLAAKLKSMGIDPETCYI